MRSAPARPSRRHVWLIVGLWAITALGAGNARANGRFPATVNTRFQPGNDQLLLVPSTFGLLVSRDDGATFHWVCEDTIGYGGTYDPDYAITSDGRIYATTFEGLRVSRDGGCSFESVEFYERPGQRQHPEPHPTPLRNIWVGEVEIASDGRIWASTSTGGRPNDVYFSDDGVTFHSAGLWSEGVWFRSVVSAPSDPDVLYVSGFKLSEETADGGLTQAQAVLYRTDDAGQTWIELDTSGFEFGSQPNLYLEGVLASDPQVVFARVLAAIDPAGDALYRSADGGTTWGDGPVLVMDDSISAFATLEDGTTVIAGTPRPCPGEGAEAAKGCVRISTEAGVAGSWNAPDSEPLMACVGERSDGVLFACGANWLPDNFAVGRSTDGGQTWEKVLQFSEIKGPLSCPEGEVQQACAIENWPGLCVMLGICAAPADGGAGAADAGQPPDNEGGCGCRAGGGRTGLATGFLFIIVILRWRRRSIRRPAGRECENS